MKTALLLVRGLLLASLASLTIGLPATYAQSSAAPDLPTLTQTLSLRDALAAAQSGNVSVRQSRADADAANADARSAQARQKPSVSTTTYATAGDSSNILTTSPGVMPQNFFAVPARGFADQDIMVMVPLFTGGTLAGRAASLRGIGAAARAQVQGSLLAITATVTQAYAEAALQTALMAAAEARLSAEDEQVRVTQKRVRAGRLAPVDLLREQAAQAEARQNALAAASARGQALVSLKSILGVSQSSELTLSDTLDTLAAQTPTLPPTLADALRTARARRPELQAAQRRVDAAQANVGVSKGAYAPQIYAVGMADAMTGSGGPGRTGFTVGVTASLPLYDAGERRADVDGASARLERARADSQQAEQQVEQETAMSWLTWQTAAAQVQAARPGVAAAQEGYDLANLRYNAGHSLTTERLDALAALVRAQAALAQAKADLVTARARLQAVLGGTGAG